jgi:hypothetical protein
MALDTFRSWSPKRRCLAVHRLTETPRMQFVEFSCATARNGSNRVILVRPGRQFGKCTAIVP